MKKALFSNMRPGFYLGLLAVVVLLLLGTTRCCAQTKQTAVYDTVYCNVDCIQKYVSKQTPKSTRLYAVYVDKEQGIADLISISRSVYDYVLTCKEYGLKPSLGIKLKNGEIYSIVKLKKNIRWKR